jgi:hypothetical protein
MHEWIPLTKKQFKRIRTIGGDKPEMKWEEGTVQCRGCGCISAQQPHGLGLSHTVELIERREGNQDCFTIVV